MRPLCAAWPCDVKLNRWAVRGGGVLLLGLLTLHGYGQSNVADARRSAAELWRSVEQGLVTSLQREPGFVDLRTDEVTRQLAAKIPDWFVVQQLDTLFAECAARFDDPRLARFRYAWNQWLEQLTCPTAEQISAAAVAGLAHDASVSANALELARQRFVADLERFEPGLRAWTDARGWALYLQIAELKTATRDGNALRAHWKSVDHVPERWRVAMLITPSVSLQRASRSLVQLACRARVCADPTFVETRQAKLERLANLLDRPSGFQDGLPPGEVAEICHWLRKRDTDGGIVSAVERRFVFPNLVIRVPQAALPPQFNRTLAEDFPVDDVIVGTRVRGNGRLTGRLTSQFQPGIDQGILEMTLQGQSVASTVGSSRGVTVRSTGITQLRGTKRLLIDPGGVHPLPAKVDGTTRISYQGINAPRRLVERQARSSVYASQGRAERESAEKTASDTAARLDRAVSEATSALNRELQNRILLPLASHEAWPQVHTVRSDSSGLVMGLLKKAPHRFGAPGPPPETSSQGVQILMHGSFAEELLARWVQGRTVPGQELRRWFATSTDPAVPMDAGDQWTLSFPEIAPCSVTFQDDAVDITLRLAGFHAQDRDFAGVEVSVRYLLRQVGGRGVLQRDGEFQVYPIGFIRGEHKLSGPQLATRDVLRRKLDVQVPREFDVGNLLGLDHAAAWKLTGCSIVDGWLGLW